MDACRLLICRVFLKGDERILQIKKFWCSLKQIRRLFSWGKQNRFQIPSIRKGIRIMFLGQTRFGLPVVLCCGSEILLTGDNNHVVLNLISLWYHKEIRFNTT